ncbi:glycosyltransferase [Schaalia suimastitidis]|uniref:glycosyltransferase n=1 Tax=Schaalia suimastitidis TaxID=121163 RepID=UPI00040E842E|nr:glycosyltransferase [Schaalia suimastitidis]
MYVLIPAYRPDLRLPRLISELRAARNDLKVVVVDDGSGLDFRIIFEAALAAGATVLSYPKNRGKGHALRQGFAHISHTAPGEAVVTADADGQHLVADIVRVAAEVEASGAMVLGVRAFDPTQPLRSKIGNRATALFFSAATGWNLSDTQTGLRGFAAEHLTWLQGVKGDRYEYEFQVLLEATRRKVERREVPVTAVYEPGNPTSHFHPIRDSIRIWAPLVGFAASSGLAAIIDYVLTVGLSTITGAVFIPMVIARITSGAVNFMVNRRVFHAAPGTIAKSAARYVGLAMVVLAGAYAIVTGLMSVGMPLWIAKPIADVTMWASSFVAQQRYVFRSEEEHLTQTQPSQHSVSTATSSVEAVATSVSAASHAAASQIPVTTTASAIASPATSNVTAMPLPRTAHVLTRGEKMLA